MPDNPLPPWWGPAPFDERDLDALLSGETTDIPELRPVADALAALQAEPMPAELRGQAIIMAEFRAAGLAQDSRAGDAAQTLVLSGPQERLGHRSAPRHRGRRRTTPVASWRTGTLISAVAVAAVVLAVVLTGNVPGPFQHLVNPSAITWGNSSSPKVQGSATPVPTSTPTPSASLTPQQSQASMLCNAYYTFFAHPVPTTDWRQEASRFHQLSKQLSRLAGGSRQVSSFCTQYVSGLFPQGIPANLPHFPGSGEQGSGSSQVSQDNQSGAVAHP